MNNNTNPVEGGAMSKVRRTAIKHDRRHFIGGSDARIIMGKTPARAAMPAICEKRPARWVPGRKSQTRLMPDLIPLHTDALLKNLSGPCPEKSDQKSARAFAEKLRRLTHGT
jgi:hypothetical protein